MKIRDEKIGLICIPPKLTSSGGIVYIKSSILRANWNNRSNCCNKERFGKKKKMHKNKVNMVAHNKKNLAEISEHIAGAIEGRGYYEQTEEFNYLRYK